jgi:cytochrome P450
MEPFIVGGLTAITAVLGVAFWQLLVRPETMLALWADPRESDIWFQHHPATLRALRYTLGTVLFLSGFLTGLALTFLLGT